MYKQKNEINILMLNDVDKLFPDATLKYLVIEQKENIEIKEIPLVFNGYLSILYDYLAYDYDDLSEIEKEKYKLKYKKMKLIEKDKYKFDIKTYVKKNNQI
jgi:hypothetical protein